MVARAAREQIRVGLKCHSHSLIFYLSNYLLQWEWLSFPRHADKGVYACDRLKAGRIRPVPSFKLILGFIFQLISDYSTSVCSCVGFTCFATIPWLSNMNLSTNVAESLVNSSLFTVSVSPLMIISASLAIRAIEQRILSAAPIADSFFPKITFVLGRQGTAQLVQMTLAKDVWRISTCCAQDAISNLGWVHVAFEAI